jgi:hypothetical protein
MSTSFSLPWLSLSWMYPLIINHRFAFMLAGERTEVLYRSFQETAV